MTIEGGFVVNWCHFIDLIESSHDIVRITLLVLLAVTGDRPAVGGAIKRHAP
jgi:hypothetical protein